MAPPRDEVTMKAILAFNLPDEASEFERASHADDWYGAVYDIVTEIRQRVKYGGAGDVEDLSRWVWNMLNERGLDPYKE